MVPNFTGRETECEEISSLMTSDSTRFVNIWGSPGFGKTSTAIAVAHHLQSLGHPVYYSAFRGKSSKDGLILKLLSIFQSFSKSNASVSLTPANRLLSIFREIPCHFFLILDNLDDLLSCKSNDSATSYVKDELVDLIREILGNCPTVTLATTTRESLQFMDLEVEGYKSFKIGPLDKRSSNNLILKLLPSPITATEDVILNVTKISGNVPLAIKLVCSSILENAETPEKCLDDLVNCSENLLEVLDNPDYPNHLRLKKLFDSSFERLSQNEKEAFISLSVFLGSDFNVDAAVAVINGNKTLAKRTLNILARKSFIERNSNSKVRSLHPLLQFFAAEKGENEFNEVAFTAKTRFYSYHLRLFENLNEYFLTGKSFLAVVTFFQQRKNIHLSFYGSLSHEGLCEKVFQVLAKSELFLVTLNVDNLDSVESLYTFAIKKSKEQKNDLDYCKLVVSKCFKNTFYTGNTFSILNSEIILIRNKIVSMYDGIEAKCLCYEGIHAVSNGMIKPGVKLMEKGILDLTKSFDQQILKCLTLQLLALYYKFLKNWEKLEQFLQMALDQCKEFGIPRLFVIGEYGTNMEKSEEEKALTVFPLENLPLILGHVCVLSIWARQFLSDKMKSRLCNIVCELQSQLEVAAQSSGNATSLFQIGDLALVFLRTDQTTQIDETIQSIENAIKTEKNSVSLTKTGEETLKKPERQKELEERLAQCYFNKAWCHNTKEEKSLALESFQKALDVRLELYGRQHPTIADTYIEIGVTQNNMEDYSSALESHQCALEIRKKLHGEEHETTAESYSQIGKVQTNMGDYATAVKSHRRALDIRLKFHGEQHETTAESCSAIGRTQNNMEDYSSALESYRRALDIILNLHGEQHPATAESYSNIGIVQNNMGDYSSALKSHRRALDIRLKFHGEQHETTAESCSAIGRTQNNMEDYSSALESHRRALDIILNLHGEQHPATAESYSNIGIVQNNMGDCSSALKSHRRALDIRLKFHGEQHETTAESCSAIGRTQNNMEDYSSALESHRRALDIILNLRCEQHPATAESYSNIGIVQNNMGDYSSALKSHHRALDIRLNLHGENHSSTADSYFQIGNTKGNMADLTSALESYQRALKIRLKLYGEQHSKVAAVYYRMGIIQCKMGEYVVSRESLQRALDTRLKLYGEEHETTAESYFQMGTTQLKMGDYRSALNSHQRGVDIRLKLHEHHSTTVDSYIQIGITQNKLNDYAAALESIIKALKLSCKLNGELHATTADCYRYKAINLQKLGKRDLASEDFQRERFLSICFLIKKQNVKI